MIVAIMTEMMCCWFTTAAAAAAAKTGFRGGILQVFFSNDLFIHRNANIQGYLQVFFLFTCGE